MNNFALLWGKILQSSIWVKESKETRLVWIAMLALKDFEGKIQASVIGLADSAKVSPDECRMALAIFLAPDPDDTSKVEDGRRIREIPGGWEIINHDLYRFSTEAKREFWRQSKEEQRARTKKKLPSEREARFVKAHGDGNDELCNEIAAENLPQPRQRFEKPTIEAIKLHAAKIGLSDTEAEKFLNYYESNGWRVGKNPMKSWPHALTNWKNNLQNYGNKNTDKPNPRNAGIAKDAAEQGRETVAFLTRKAQEREEAAAHELAAKMVAP